MTYKCKLCLFIFNSKKDVIWRNDLRSMVCKECNYKLEPEPNEDIDKIIHNIIEKLNSQEEKIKIEKEEFIDMEPLKKIKSYKNKKTGKIHKCRYGG